MPVFAFEAIKEDGQKVKSEVTAESKDEAIRKIQDKGLRPIAVKAEKKSSFGSKKSGFKGNDLQIVVSCIPEKVDRATNAQSKLKMKLSVLIMQEQNIYTLM